MGCKKCGKCCYKYGIPVSITDINREPLLLNVTVPFKQVKNPKMRAYMIEKRLPFVIGKTRHGAACPFLSANNLCLIYNTRPQICRDYPQETKYIREEKECLL